MRIVIKILKTHLKILEVPVAPAKSFPSSIKHINNFFFKNRSFNEIIKREIRNYQFILYHQSLLSLNYLIIK